jgi:hypothetical protein
MPLTPGKSKRVVSENIREMIGSGKPQRQAVAIALKSAGRARLPKAGKKVRRAMRKVSKLARKAMRRG